MSQYQMPVPFGWICETTQMPVPLGWRCKTQMSVPNLQGIYGERTMRRFL